MKDTMSLEPQLSLAKDKIRVLLLEGVNESVAELFRIAGYSNLERVPRALDGRSLRDAVMGVHLLGIRSRTQITYIWRLTSLSLVIWPSVCPLDRAQRTTCALVRVAHVRISPSVSSTAVPVSQRSECPYLDTTTANA
jgi:hypothetical protein